MEGNSGDVGSIPGSRRSPRGGNGHPLVFLPGKSHGQRSLMGHSPWGHTDRGAWQATLCLTHTHTHTHSLSACLCLSLFLCVSHCISLSVCLCLSFSLSLSLPLSFSSDLRRRRTVPRQTFESHWRRSGCSMQTLLLSLICSCCGDGISVGREGLRTQSL